ncbi:MAG: NADH-specific enoyl-ACP reductase, partial [Parvibaculum sp.]|nr:NADH-specific enoyl-ACP reductase [Parvibaculum sp.]
MHGSDNKTGEGGLTLTGPLMKGKRGLIMGVANDHSIAWGIANMLGVHGEVLAFTYQGDAFGKRVKPLADCVGSK